MLSTRLVAVSIAIAACFPAAAQLNDGNMDSLTVGTAPDNGVPAGAWGFPDNYAGLVDELDPLMVSIVATNSFDPGATGNSLALDFNDPNNIWNIHLPNVLTSSIVEAPGLIVTVQFDIYVVSGFAGGSIYVGGDHGGGGYSNASDRGPQLSWFADGNINWTMTGGVNTLLTTFSFNTWQRMRLEINLTNDTYNAFYGPRAGPLTQVGTNLTFRSITLDHIDRFTRVDFAAFANPSRSYIDNVSVTVPSVCPGDLNNDHQVTLADLTLFLSTFGSVGPGIPSDFDHNGSVGLSDLTFLLSHFGMVCTSPVPPPAPHVRPARERPVDPNVDVTGP